MLLALTDQCSVHHFVWTLSGSAVLCLRYTSTFFTVTVTCCVKSTSPPCGSLIANYLCLLLTAQNNTSQLLGVSIGSLYYANV